MSARHSFYPFHRERRKAERFTYTDKLSASSAQLLGDLLSAKLPASSRKGAETLRLLELQEMADVTLDRYAGTDCASVQYLRTSAAPNSGGGNSLDLR